MTQTNPSPPSVEVMWRPGCPFCSALRRGLNRAGVATVEHDIWSSTDAAARVRGATGGDETVPTVFLGDQALVNPSVRQVVAAIRIAHPDYQPVSPRAASHAESAGTRESPSPGLLWTLVVAVVWSLLVAALAITGVLSAAGRLDGPTWTGSGTPVVEALLLSAGGAAIATTVGLLRTVRLTTRASARRIEIDGAPGAD